MPFKDYYEVIDPLELPIRGKIYRIPAVPFKDMERWKRYRAALAAGSVPDDEKLTNEDFYRLFLGPVHDEFMADGVHPDVAAHAVATALAEAEFGREYAEKVWANPGPKVSTPQPTVPEKGKGSTRSRSTAAASTTKRPARTSGTKPRPK